MKLVLAATLAANGLQAEVTLPRILGSHMVLQREAPLHFWGWAAADENVSVTMNGSSRTTTANRLGRWEIYLPPMAAGGPYQAVIKGSNSITLDDILLGDVWFASGQSNMEMPLAGFPGNAVIKDGDQEIQNANHPEMRLFIVKKHASDHPLHDVEGEWSASTPQTAKEFSAVGYFFGRQIQADERVPVGLIDSTWGGTPIEAWTSMDALGADAALMPVFAEWSKMANRTADVGAMLRAEKQEDAAAAQAGQPKPHHDWHPDQASWQPAGLYNGMVAPVSGLRMKGVIWYQGESNAANARAHLYERELPTLISDWRSHWQEGNFPFLFVQIANFSASSNESYQTIREAERRSLAVANTGMAVTIDIGQPENVHPANKQEVGRRLALAAEAIAYGKQIEYSGPMFRETSINGPELQVWFDHATGGLRGTQGFEIAGSDHNFVPATARIEGNTVILKAEGVSAPLYARYGWANAPIVNLFNGAGLPASPFTSEP